MVRKRSQLPAREVDVPEQGKQTPRGHDLGLIDDMLALTPTERVRANSRWVSMIEKLRGQASSDGSRNDPTVIG